MRLASSISPVAALFIEPTQGSDYDRAVLSGISPVANSRVKAHSNADSERPRAAIADSIVETVVRDDADAFHLLFDTALHHSSQNDHPSAISSGSHPPSHSRKRMSDSTLQVNHDSTAQPTSQSIYDRNVGGSAEDGLLKELPVSYAEQLSLWSRFQPCVQRYLSPVEAIAYLD